MVLGFWFLEPLVEHIVEALQTLVSRVRARVPEVTANAANHGLKTAGGLSGPYASFLATPNSESLDLEVDICDRIGAVRVSADLVWGGSGEVRANLPQRTVPARRDSERVREILDELRAFILGQEDEIVSQLFLELSGER